MADYIYYVNPDSAASGDGTTDTLSGGSHAYQSLNAAIVALAGNETGSGAGTSGDSITFRCSGNGSNWIDTTGVTITGFTSGVEVIIEGYNGNYTGRQTGDTYDNTNCYALECSTASTTTIASASTTNKVTVKYVQVDNKNASNFMHAIELSGALSGDKHLVDSCRIKVTKSNGSKNGHGIRCKTTQALNCTIEGNGNSATTGFDQVSAAECWMFNCTIYNCGEGIDTAASCDLDVQNVAIAGCTNDWVLAASQTGTKSHNADSNDGDTPGTNNQTLSTTLTDEFTSPSTGDFTVASDGASNNIWDNGTSGGNIPTVDIQGTSRSNYSIGAFEYVSAGGVTEIPPPLHKLDNQYATITAHRLGGVLQ